MERILNLLIRNGLRSLETASNWIFPYGLFKGSFLERNVMISTYINIVEDFCQVCEKNIAQSIIIII